MIHQIISSIVHSPLYPHWLESLKKDQADNLLLTVLHGKVIEVGAGDGHRKGQLLQKNPRIKSYLATDYAEWDGEFSKIDLLIKRFGKPMEIILGYHERIKLDRKCDAMDLPFKNGSFDCHVSFETIEHISEPEQYFSEATRVVKKNGYIYVSVPFLYRMHGGEPDHKWDFYRYAFGFFHKVASDNNLKIIQLYSNTGIGTTVASMINQYVIRRLFESPLILKFLWIALAAPIFVTTNVVGYLVDFKPDVRFSTRYHVLFQKK